ARVSPKWGPPPCGGPFPFCAAHRGARGVERFFQGSPKGSRRGQPWEGATQPLRGWDPFAGFTQGSRGRQPWDGATQPLRGWDPFARFAQGSRGRQPWAGRRNPFGFGTLLRVLPRVAADGNPGLDDATPSGLKLRAQNS